MTRVPLRFCVLLARRPTVSARLMVNSTLGPGTAISTVTTAANAST